MTEDPGGLQPGGHGTRGPLPARSALEAHLWLDLHPCECGASRPRCSQDLRDDGNGGLMSVYAGNCPGCGRRWSAAFILPASPRPAGCIGGSEPSGIIDPGQWLYLSDQAAGFTASGAPGPADRERLRLAAGQAEEAAKFIPPGHDRVPDAAFTSQLGRAMRLAFPDRFQRTDLCERAQLYRAGAALHRGHRSREMAG